MPIYSFQNYTEEKIEKGKTGYYKMTVNYSAKGESKSKNIMSFANPTVYDTIKKLNEGDQIEVEFVKDDKYFNWASVKPVAGVVQGTAGNPQEGTIKAQPAARSTYETAEERARKQVYIIKQSCLAQALVYFGDTAREMGHKEITGVAQQFVDWVMDDSKDLFKEPNDL